MDPLVEKHWPQLAALHRALEALPETVTIAAQSSRREPTEAEIDAIHQGLLRKQRGGSLGLNE